MTLRRCARLCAFILWPPLLAATVPLFAQEAQPAGRETAVRQERLLSQLEARHGTGWSARWAADGSRVTALMIARKAPPAVAAPSKEPARGAAELFLRENASLFALSPDLADLRLVAERASPGGSHLEYQQTYQGLPVDNARVKVNLDRQGRVVQVESGYLPGFTAELEPAVSQDEAVERAKARLLSFIQRQDSHWGPSRQEEASSRELRLASPPEVVRVLFAQEGRGVIAYKVLLHSQKPPALMELTVSGATGEILRARNRLKSAVDGQGRVFIPNPVVATNDGTLRDNNDTANLPAGAYTNVSLLDLDDADGGGSYHVSGLYAASEDIESPATAVASETTSSFLYDHGGDGFEEAMVYFHLDTVQRYLQSLGFIDANNRRIRFDAHAESDFANAHYWALPLGAGYLTFGDSHVDFAEDGDVIVHEYGHSLQDNQNPGAYDYDPDTEDQTGAMGEGFGDYLACSIFLTAATASGWDSACLGEWVQLNDNNVACTRRADTGKVFPADYVDEVHTDGEIWAGALWDILQRVGKTTADRLALQSHFNVPAAPNFRQGADAVLTADLQLFYGSHLEALCQVFLNRGIYLPGDCPQVPSSSGSQDTLVLLVRFADAGLPASPLTFPDVQDLIDAWNDYLTEVAYGQATLNATIKGWHPLPHDRDHYYDEASGNVLVELVRDGLAALQTAEASLDLTAFERVIVITNDDGSGGETRGLTDWATTGPWSYDLPGGAGTKLLSASVHRFDHSEARFTHALGHHFRLVDLYAHEGVAFPRPYADGWDNMARSAAGELTNVHYLGWSKARPRWLDDADVELIPHPGTGAIHDGTYPLTGQEADGSGRELLQIATTLDADRNTERVSYYVEARKQDGPYDGGLPGEGVVVYFVNEDIGQGFGPVRLVDATPGDSDLTNAAFQIGQSVTNIDGTGLDLQVLAPTGAEDYRVRVRYDPPDDQVDAWIHSRDVNWRSEDIWVDSQACTGETCGFDQDSGRTETDRGDKPRPGEVNRLYARVYNHGPDTAHDVRIDFWLSDPYHGIDGGAVDPDTGGNTAFNKHLFTVLDTLPPAADGVPVYVEWIPEPVPAGQPYPHACVKVKIQRVVHDVNDYNQVSQENIAEYDTTGDSPYDPVVDPFRVVNPYDHPILVYLRPEGVPVGWSAVVAPEKVYLPVGGSADAQVTIQAPEDYPVCATEMITVTGWYPSGDTLVELGGTTAQVNLKKSAELTVETELGPCRREVLLLARAETELPGGECTALSSRGCTQPPLPNQHVTVRYTGPDGQPVYHDVVTGADGCFEDFLVNPRGGVWQVGASHPGDECNAGAETPRQPVVVPPRLPAPSTRFWYSFHLGLGFPQGLFSKDFDPGPSLALDLEYPMTELWNLRALLGFHYFHGVEQDLSYNRLALELRRYFPVYSWRAFFDFGGGYYLPNHGPNRFGVDLGGGLWFQLQPRLALELGAHEHLVDPGGDDRAFTDLTLGLSFRF